MKYYFDNGKATIQEGECTIEEYAFAENPCVENVVVPNSVESIGRCAFCECENLTGIVLSDSVKSICQSAFEGSGLTSVTIPDSVTSIGWFAFEYCYSLTSITFEGTAPEIGADAFGYVTATVYYPANDPSWTEEVQQNYGGELTWVAY